MWTTRIALASLACLIATCPASAALKLWQQTFVGCSTSSSPYANQVLFRDGASVRPLMQIDGMNAWAVTTKNGHRRFALTTPDGLTIYGRIVGPEGEDISAALLATKPTVRPRLSSLDQPESHASDPADVGPPVIATPSAAAIPEPKGAGTARTFADKSAGHGKVPQAPSGTDRAALKGSTGNKKSTGQEPVQAAQPETRSAEANKDREGASARQQMSIGSQTVADVPQAKTLDGLLRQARSFAMWFPLDKAKVDAPVVYMFVDPTCPHCAWSIDHLLPKIRNGSVAFRVILTPILSKQAFDVAASVMQQEDIAASLIDQTQSILGNGKPAPTVDPASFDKRVIAGLRRNVLWMRANGVPGVPFYLYRTAKGAQFAFGSLTNAQIRSALPDRTPPARAAGNTPDETK